MPSTMACKTWIGISFPGLAGTPVMKSVVMKVRMAMDRLVVASLPVTSKSMGNEITGTCNQKLHSKQTQMFVYSYLAEHAWEIVLLQKNIDNVIGLSQLIKNIDS